MDNNEDQIAAPNRETLSPTKESRSKASTGAAKAAAAAALAQRLLEQTRSSISAASLNDLKLPCSPVCPVTLEAEEKKAANADTVAPSPWCAGATRPSAEIPANPGDSSFVELQNAALSALYLHRPLSYDAASVLFDIIGFGVEGIKQLDLRRALVASQTPPPPAQRLQQLMAEIEAEVGPEDVPENVEKLQQMVEKAKGEFTSYERGIKFLAEKKLNRFDALCRALLRGSSLVELNLANNQLGAPNAEGRSNYHDLRRLGQVIDETSSIQVLDLSANNMGPVGVGIVAKALTKNITIHSLNLAGNDIFLADPPEEEDDPDKEEEDAVFGEYYNGLEALSEVIKKNKFLRCLSLRNNGIKGEVEEGGEDDGAETTLGKFVEPLKKYHRLEVLDLGSNELGPGGARTLSAALSLNRSIRILDLSDNAIGVSGLAFVARLVAASSTLNTLVLNKNEITVKKDSKRAHKQAVEVFSAFSTAVGGSVSLRTLAMNGHHFGPLYSAMILAGLPGSRVTELHFSGNDMCGTPDAPGSDMSALQLVLQAMQRTTDDALRVVQLAGNHMCAQGAQTIAPFVPTLLSIDLSRNALSNDGVGFITDAMTNGTAVCTLEHLDLSHNGLTTISAIPRIIRGCTSLKHLNLGGNHVAKPHPDPAYNADEFAYFQDFSHAVLSNPSLGGRLHSLNLSSNGLGETHVECLKALVGDCQPPFSVLDIMDNPLISLESAQAIIASLGRNNSLRVLRISSQYGDRTAIMDAAFAALEQNRRIVDLDLCLPTDIEEKLLDKLKFKLLHNALIGIDQTLY